MIEHRKTRKTQKLSFTVNHYPGHELRSTAVGEVNILKLLNSLNRNKTYRMKLSLRSQGVEEFFSQETP